MHELLPDVVFSRESGATVKIGLMISVGASQRCNDIPTRLRWVEEIFGGRPETSDTVGAGKRKYEGVGMQRSLRFLMVVPAAPSSLVPQARIK